MCSQVEGIEITSGIAHARFALVCRFFCSRAVLAEQCHSVGIAGLSGSILARNRAACSSSLACNAEKFVLPGNFLLRFSLPPLLLFTTALYALPRTTANVRAEMWDLETTRIPAFARFHATAYDHSLMALDRVKEGTETIRERFDSSAKGIGGFIQDKSGVKMGDLVHSQERFGGSSAEAGTVERLEKAVDVPGKESSEKRVL